MKILGIVGGMGPYAALEFNKLLLDNTDAKKDWEHIHTILDNDITIPSRTRHILYGEESPVKAIIEAINRLASIQAKAVVLPCNSVHYFYDKVSSKINIPWLNMLSIVGDMIKNTNKKRTLVLGGYVTVNKKTYDEYLINSFYLNEEENSRVYDLIEAVKINNQTKVEEVAKELVKIFDNYKEDNNIDSILFGCTELSVSTTLQNYTNIEIFDSNNIYAQYAVEYMRKKNETV